MMIAADQQRDITTIGGAFGTDHISSVCEVCYRS